MSESNFYPNGTADVKVKVAVLDYEGTKLIIPDAKSLMDVLGVGYDDTDGSTVYQLSFKEITCKELNDLPEFDGF